METDWVQEFDGFADAPPTAAAAAGSGQGGAPRSRNARNIDALEQELKLLHWHKLANEAALKAALIRTKKLKDADSGRAVVETRKETAQWMQQIIEEEQSKPLEVTEDFILKYEAQQREDEERLEEEVQRHIKSLQRIKINLKNKEEMRRRTLLYRKKRKQLMEASRGGGGGISMRPPALDDDNDHFELPGGATPIPNLGQSGAGGMQGTLSKVISSLDKLVDLEKRIARLETDVDGEGGHRRTDIKFTKRRQEATPTAPARNVFSVREVPRRARRGPGGHGGHGGRRSKSPAVRGGASGSGGGSRREGQRRRRRRGDGNDRSREPNMSELMLRQEEEDARSRDQFINSYLDGARQADKDRAIARRRAGGMVMKPTRKRGEKGPGEIEIKPQQFRHVRREFEKRAERKRRRAAQEGGGASMGNLHQRAGGGAGSPGDPRSASVDPREMRRR